MKKRNVQRSQLPSFLHRYVLLMAILAVDVLAVYVPKVPLHKTRSKGHVKAIGVRSTSFENSPLSQPALALPKNHYIRGGGAEDTATTSGGSSMVSSIFNLVNNVAGAGILTLSAGKAKGTGWLPSILITVLLGILSSNTFVMVGQSCDMMGETDFKGLWGRTLGKKSAWVVDTSIAILCCACAVIYSGILGDVFTPLFKSLGIPDAFNFRTTNILVLTAVILYPLALIRDLSRLAFTSVLGAGAVAYTVAFVVWRSLDGCYFPGEGKFIVDKVLEVPTFEGSSLWGINFSSLVLASNLGLAYIAHYNAPAYYRSLRKVTVARFAHMVTTSFAILATLYAVTMSAGYSTFGDTVRGNILLNYHPQDPLAVLARLATGISILFGYPLIMAGVKEGISSVLGVELNAGHVACLLGTITAIAVSVEDVSVVVGLTGAVLGSALVYIFPAFIYREAVRQTKGDGTPSHRRAVLLSKTLLPFGLLIGGLGAFMTLKENGLL